MKMKYRGKQQHWFAIVDGKIVLSAYFWCTCEDHVIMSCITDENGKIFDNVDNKTLNSNDKYYQLTSRLSKLLNDNKFDEIHYDVINQFEYIC